MKYHITNISYNIFMNIYKGRLIIVNLIVPNILFSNFFDNHLDEIHLLKDIVKIFTTCYKSY